MFPRLRADLTLDTRQGQGQAEFFLVLSALPAKVRTDAEQVYFRFRNLPAPIRGMPVPSEGRDAAIAPELVHQSASLLDLEAALCPPRQPMAGYSGRAIRLSNIRSRFNIGTIRQRLEDAWGIHGLATRPTSLDPAKTFEPIVKLPKCATTSVHPMSGAP